MNDICVCAYPEIDMNDLSTMHAHFDGFLMSASRCMCIYIYIYLCMHTLMASRVSHVRYSMHVYTLRLHVCICICTHILIINVCMYTYMSYCLSASLRACLCIGICCNTGLFIYIHSHTHTHTINGVWHAFSFQTLRRPLSVVCLTIMERLVIQRHLVNMYYFAIKAKKTRVY